MRKLFSIIITFCAAYFIFGLIAAYLEFWSFNTYLQYSSWVGSFASIIGLITLVKAPLTKNDLKELEVSALKSLGETAQELEILQKKQLVKKNELNSLQIQKKEMELLVKKASYALFLKEQYSQKEKQLIEIVENNKDLKNILLELHDIKLNIKSIDDDIDSHPNVELLHEIIGMAKYSASKYPSHFQNLPMPTRFLAELTYDLAKNLQRNW